MKKDKRITSNLEFQEILFSKSYLSSKKFIIYFRDKKENYARIGLSVGKKLGIAVLRNKIKRQLRMMLTDLNFEELRFDLIIIVRKSYLESSFAENERELLKMIKKINKEKIHE